MMFRKRQNVVLCFIIFYRTILLSNVLPNLYLFKLLIYQKGKHKIIMSNHENLTLVPW